MSKVISAFFMILLSSNIFSDTFDCERTPDIVDRLICSNQTLLDLDKELSTSYQSKLEFLIEPGRDRIWRDQDIWLRYTRSRCGDINCLISAYKIRISDIEKYKKEEKVSYLSINGKDYTIIQPYKFEDRISSFNVAGAIKAGGRITTCAEFVDVSSSTGDGIHSFGGYCYFQDHNGVRFRKQVCSNDIGNKFKMDYSVGGDDVHLLSVFILEGCGK